MDTDGSRVTELPIYGEIDRQMVALNNPKGRVPTGVT